MSDDEVITVGSLRLRKDKVVSSRVVRTDLGRVAEVRFLLDENDGVEDTVGEVPQEIKS